MERVQPAALASGLLNQHLCVARQRRMVMTP